VETGWRQLCERNEVSVCMVIDRVFQDISWEIKHHESPIGPTLRRKLIVNRGSSHLFVKSHLLFKNVSSWSLSAVWEPLAVGEFLLQLLSFMWFLIALVGNSYRSPKSQLISSEILLKAQPPVTLPTIVLQGLAATTGMGQSVRIE